MDARRRICVWTSGAGKSASDLLPSDERGETNAEKDPFFVETARSVAVDAIRHLLANAPSKEVNLSELRALLTMKD